MKQQRLAAILTGIAAMALAGCANTSGSRHAVQSLGFVANQGAGIVAVRLNQATGELTPIGVVAEVNRPTWIVEDRRNRRIFVVSEVGGPDTNGAVEGFSYDPQSGALTNPSRADAGGDGPAHLALSADGKTVFAANYVSGQVVTIAVNDDGRLAAQPTIIVNHTGSGPHRRQATPHTHGVTLDPSEQFLLTPDLGADKVFIYRVNPADHTIVPAATPFAALPPGSGPRHIVFSPKSGHAFVMTEMDASITSFDWDARTGSLAKVSSVAMDAPDAPGNRSGSELAVSADERYLYAANRGANRIQVYRIAADGSLALVQTIDSGGTVPWGFAISGSGKWLVVANQGSGNLAVFAVDRGSGRLTAVPGGLAVTQATSLVLTDSGAKGH